MKKKLRILVVDDDSRMARTLIDILNIKGYVAQAVYSGSEALRTLQLNRYDCILSDIKMQDVSGVDLLKAVKNMYPDLPVVLMTAYSTDTLVGEARKEGALTILTKPLDIKTLLDFMSSLCSN